jgi:hypothetical protein
MWGGGRDAAAVVPAAIVVVIVPSSLSRSRSPVVVEQSLTAGWRGAVRVHRPVVVVAPAPFPRCPCPRCSRFHPTSSCSRGRLGVMWSSSSPRRCGCRAVGVLGRPCHPCLCRCPCHVVVVVLPTRSASNHSRQQLRVQWWYLLITSPSSFCYCCLSSQRQLADVVSLLSFVVRRVVPVISQSVVYQQTALRPVARSGGGGCWIPRALPVSR